MIPNPDRKLFLLFYSFLSATKLEELNDDYINTFSALQEMFFPENSLLPQYCSVHSMHKLLCIGCGSVHNISCGAFTYRCNKCSKKKQKFLSKLHPQYFAARLNIHTDTATYFLIQAIESMESLI